MGPQEFKFNPGEGGNLESDQPTKEDSVELPEGQTEMTLESAVETISEMSRDVAGKAEQHVKSFVSETKSETLGAAERAGGDLTPDERTKSKKIDDAVGGIAETLKAEVSAIGEKEAEKKEENPIQDEIARRYEETSKGLELLDYQDATHEEIVGMLKDPEKFRDRFYLEDEDISKIKEWVVKDGEAEQARRALYDALKAAQPENPLFKESFEGVPPDYVSVFHFTGRGRMERLGKEGLRPTKEAMSDDEKKGYKDRFIFDEKFDAAAPEGYSRSGAVYAYADFKGNRGNMGKGGVMLEMKVDPKKALVADAGSYSEAAERFSKGGNAEPWVKGYWEDAMTLEDFLKLPDEKRRSKFVFPEVIIQGTLDQRFMRVHSVESDQEL